ncbi:hypothetical protein INR49_008485 [Caranx melampygus]|nr:hypothetical protein INR49_008485 [Caranx melampygus]
MDNHNDGNKVEAGPSAGPGAPLTPLQQAAVASTVPRHTWSGRGSEEEEGQPASLLLLLLSS